MDTIRADVVATLRWKLVPLQTIKAALAILADLWVAWDPLEPTKLLFVDGEVFAVPDGDTLVDLLVSRKPRKVLLVDIAEVARATLVKVAILDRLAAMALQSERKGQT